MTDTKRKILLVDDSELVVMLVGECLKNAGYEVVCATNGLEGVEKAYREAPDLIVMDVEMPVMMGYQASRLLKSRRGVKDIPILMHTSRQEDRDRLWAYSSGADAYIIKDFDNLATLLETVREMAGRAAPDRDLIARDGEKVNRESIFEMMNTLYDRQLFDATMLNQLGEVGRSIGDLSETVESIMGLVDHICQPSITAILLQRKKQTLAFIAPGEDTVETDVEKILPICLHDYAELFPKADPAGMEKKILRIARRDDFFDVRADRRQISSYVQYPLLGKGGEPVGSIHAGSFINNYFSDHISDNIRIFVQGAGIVLENALLLNHISEMEMKIRNVFAKFVPSDIIDDLVESQTQSSMLVGEKREVVVLFSDIRSFTTISEDNDPEHIVGFLNTYFDIMVSAITKHGGTIDKFIGDAILAIFGAPKSYEDNALRAVAAAVEMVRSLGKVDYPQVKLPAEGLGMGIGIHEGDLIVGNIGCKDKFDYTVIGDTVNLASRLEGLTKHYRQHIIVSDKVMERIDDKFHTRELDSVKVKGKSEATRLYSVSIEQDEDVAAGAECRRDFSKAMEMYKIRNWNTAIEYFEKTLEYWRDDYVSKMYVARCREFLVKPPPEDWDGSMKLDFK